MNTRDKLIVALLSCSATFFTAVKLNEGYTEKPIRVQNHVLSSCITEYRTLAKIADEHRADAERK